ncbi:MAG: hypothetical protein ACSHWR_04500 [Psychromonas sp.]
MNIDQTKQLTLMSATAPTVGQYVHQMHLNHFSAIAAGREI